MHVLYKNAKEYLVSLAHAEDLSLLLVASTISAKQLCNLFNPTANRWAVASISAILVIYIQNFEITRVMVNVLGWV